MLFHANCLLKRRQFAWNGISFKKKKKKKKNLFHFLFFFFFLSKCRLLNFYWAYVYTSSVHINLTSLLQAILFLFGAINDKFISHHFMEDGIIFILIIRIMQNLRKGSLRHMQTAMPGWACASAQSDQNHLCPSICSVVSIDSESRQRGPIDGKALFSCVWQHIIALCVRACVRVCVWFWFKMKTKYTVGWMKYVYNVEFEAWNSLNKFLYVL